MANPKSSWEQAAGEAGADSPAAIASAKGGAARRRLDVDLLSAADVQSVLAACSSRAATGIRNRALIGVLFRCGLRLGEALALSVKDVGLDTQTLVVQHGKGDKRRILGIDVGTLSLLQAWLERRSALGLGTTAPVFCTLAGGPVNQSYVRHLLKRLSRKAGVERRVHAHALRHAFAVELVRGGAPIYVVRDALGHANIATTNAYLSRVSANEVVQLMSRREWAPPEP